MQKPMTTDTLQQFFQHQSINAIGSQSLVIFKAILIQAFVMRFKRVEVQVVQDEHETTFLMLQKLKYLNNYNNAFLAVNLLF